MLLTMTNVTLLLVSRQHHISVGSLTGYGPLKVSTLTITYNYKTVLSRPPPNHA
jgi:hypothetical protein